ncbi:hypothetical protein [Streptomyces acidicola]|uniref:hypothetical protein n=1 Tax=Streptomyces acidicola TaxID=2596892 RepID=UPI0038206F6A
MAGRGLRALFSTNDRSLETDEAFTNGSSQWETVTAALTEHLDFGHLVLTIRAALTRFGRPLPAFDIALRRYWEANHPGESLKEYLRRHGLASRFGQALPQQMQSALADIAETLLLPGTIGSAIGQATGPSSARHRAGRNPATRPRLPRPDHPHLSDLTPDERHTAVQDTTCPLPPPWWRTSRSGGIAPGHGSRHPDLDGRRRIRHI